MRVLWVAMAMATSLPGCTEIPVVEGWPCVEPEDHRVVSETFAFAEGRPKTGDDGWWTWQLAVADGCPPAAPSGSFELVAKPGGPAQCQADHLGTGMSLSSSTGDGYYNGASTTYDERNGTYHYASSLPKVWFGPAGYTEKPIGLVVEVTAWHLDTDPDDDPVCLQAVVESVTLTIDYLPLLDFSGA